jgi:hypothetical protein
MRLWKGTIWRYQVVVVVVVVVVVAVGRRTAVSPARANHAELRVRMAADLWNILQKL